MGRTYRRVLALLSVAGFVAFGIPSAASALTASYTSMTYASENLTPSGGTSASGDKFVVNGQTPGTTIRCLEMRWNSQPDGSGTIPTGFGSTSATFLPAFSDYVAGLSGWTVDTTVNGTIRLTNAIGAAPGGGANKTLVVTGLVNGSVTGTTYFALLHAYSDVSCTLPNLVNNGVSAFSYRDALEVAATVQETMSFTVSPRSSACGLQNSPDGTYLYTTPLSATSMSLGRINKDTVGQSAHNLSVSSNAGAGATVFVRGAFNDHNLRDGSNQPFADSSAPPAAGTSSFSYTVSSTHNGMNSLWRGLSSSDTEVSFSPSVGAFGECIGFSAAVGTEASAGAYQATVYYTAVPHY